MMKIKRKIVVTCLLASILVNVLLIFIYINKKDINTQVLDQVIFKGIQSNLIQLEGAIKYQMETEWKNEFHVTEKLDDVVDGVGLAFEVAERTGQLNYEVQVTLWQLYNFLIKYKQDTGFPNTELTEQERKEYIELASRLRSAGWGLNIDHQSGWDSFKEKLNDLLG
ncbi:hypothetical protein KZ483_17260 [Paenibacillus sp. sptzw28]|uniref:hypothetical protein n=1 Tax=Paenibacillus sp. sptzw28 TaxID=715179 RepID=UPI001C6F0F2C|nr:hypothetical protein [Paenibacillus sp. sptzw28]QYR19640.1 hypothetical protein KZ483_17260 [Paenibacillus sp. sptzw28]